MKHIINGKLAYSNDALLEYLKDNIEPQCSLLDIGCGPKLYSSPFLEIASNVITIDAWSEVHPDILADLEKTSLKSLISEPVDYILMIDFIEHVDKANGKTIIEQCKQLVNKKIFILTPLETIWTQNHEHVDDPSLWCFNNTYDLHKSMWSKDDFLDWTEIRLPKLQHYFVGYFQK